MYICMPKKGLYTLLLKSLGSQKTAIFCYNSNFNSNNVYVLFLNNWTI